MTSSVHRFAADVAAAAQIVGRRHRHSMFVSASRALDAPSHPNVIARRTAIRHVQQAR